MRDISNAVSIARPRRFASVGKIAGLLLFLAAVFVFVPASGAQQTARAKALGQKLFCACGCSQILTACNHVGCQYSAKMIKELDERVARGDSDDVILQSFVQEYGIKVLAEPPAKGFDLAAWIVPIVTPLIAILMVWILVRRWRQQGALAVASGPPISAELLSRARHESSREFDE